MQISVALSDLNIKNKHSTLGGWMLISYYAR